MTRATLIKLLVLVLLIFIICLPEFFILSRVSKVNFLCLPFSPCQRLDAAAEEDGGRGGSESKECSSWQTAEWRKWKEVCIEGNQLGQNPESDGGDSDKNWFMCETDRDMAQLQQNHSPSALRLLFEVSVELQFRDTEELNLTLYGLNNNSFLQPHPPEQEEGERQGEEGEETEGRAEAFYCCQKTSAPAAQSQCLLWLANQTVMTAVRRPAASRDEWRCTLRILWLVLLCVVLLAIVSTVFEQILSYKKAKVHPPRHGHNNKVYREGRSIDLHASDSWAVNGRELSPIQEVESQDDIATLLDGSIDHPSTVHLHHRSHHATSSETEEMQIL